MPFSLSIETVFVLSVAVAVIALLNFFWLFFLNQKIKQLLGGTSATDIQGGLVLIRKELETLKTFRFELEKYLETVETRLKRSVQSVETVRFNPFKGTGDGGNQSFSTSIVDETGNGVVISSLYSRERVSIFSKAVKNFTSEIELTEEEKSVVQSAQRKLSKNND